MAVRSTVILLNENIITSVINANVSYSPTNAEFFTLYFWLIDLGSALYEDIVITVIKILENTPLDSEISNTFTLTAAKQALGDRAIFNSDELLPKGLCDHYTISMTSVDPLSNVNVRLTTIEA